MDLMQARRRLLMQQSGLDTSPKVLEYDKRYYSGGTVRAQNGCCITDKYDVVSSVNDDRYAVCFGVVPTIINYKNGESAFRCRI